MERSSTDGVSVTEKPSNYLSRHEDPDTCMDANVSYEQQDSSPTPRVNAINGRTQMPNNLINLSLQTPPVLRPGNKESFIHKLTNNGELSPDQIIDLLVIGTPSDLEQYSEHVFKVLSILFEDDSISINQYNRLIEKLYELFNNLPYFISLNNSMSSKLYLIIEKNFDILIKISINNKNLQLATTAIKFLTEVVMNLNYWEIYNLLSWKPAIYHFLSIIQFNLNDCYLKFINDYSNYTYRQKKLNYNKDNVGKSTKRLSEYSKQSHGRKNEGSNQITEANLRSVAGRHSKNRGINADDLDSTNNDLDADDNTKVSGSNTPISSIGDNNLQYSQNSRSSSVSNQSLLYNHENPHSEELTLIHNGTTSQLYNAQGEPLDIPAADAFINSDLRSLASKDRKRITIEPKLARRIIKRANTRISTKSANYDPDVVHECQLSSADEPGKLCLRRFSRKYELIRHQETVHSKKKKLFKCYVCVKQNPGIGPRIFTRHDTLAKHIRVNHKISGKEAKQEVAYSKKNAEIVEEGDITVHVGRRKTKVDFELRAHMEKRRMAKIDGIDYYDDEDGGFVIDDDTNNSLMLDEDDEIMDEQEESRQEYDQDDDDETHETASITVDHDNPEPKTEPRSEPRAEAKFEPRVEPNVEPYSAVNVTPGAQQESPVAPRLPLYQLQGFPRQLPQPHLQPQLPLQHHHHHPLQPQNSSPPQFGQFSLGQYQFDNLNAHNAHRPSNNNS